MSHLTHFLSIFYHCVGIGKNNNLIFQPDFFEQTFWDFRESFIHLGSIKTAPIQVLNCREFWSKHYYWKWFYLQWPNYAQFFSSRKQSVLHVIYVFKDHLDHFVLLSFNHDFTFKQSSKLFVSIFPVLDLFSKLIVLIIWVLIVYFRLFDFVLQLNAFFLKRFDNIISGYFYCIYSCFKFI